MTEKEILDLLKKRRNKELKKCSKVSLYDLIGHAKYNYAYNLLEQIMKQIKSRKRNND